MQNITALIDLPPRPVITLELDKEQYGDLTGG